MATLFRLIISALFLKNKYKTFSQTTLYWHKYTLFAQ